MTAERIYPGGWAKGIGWVAVAGDLDGDDLATDSASEYRTSCNPAAFDPTRPVIVTRWADGTVPSAPVAPEVDGRPDTDRLRSIADRIIDATGLPYGVAADLLVAADWIDAVSGVPSAPVAPEVDGERATELARWNTDGGKWPWPEHIALDGEATTIHRESVTGLAIGNLITLASGVPSTPQAPDEVLGSLADELRGRFDETHIALSAKPDDEYLEGMFTAYQVALHFVTERRVALAATPAPSTSDEEAPSEVFELSHGYLNVERCPQTLGDAMRLIGRYTESEGGNSAETRQARCDLFDAYETWCQLDRPETEYPPLTDDQRTRFEAAAERGLAARRAAAAVPAVPEPLIDCEINDAGFVFPVVPEEPAVDWHCEGDAVGIYWEGICSPENPIHSSPCGPIPPVPVADVEPQPDGPWTVERDAPRPGSTPRRPHRLWFQGDAVCWLNDHTADKIERHLAASSAPDVLRMPNGVMRDNDGVMWSLGANVPWTWETFRLGQGWRDGRDLAASCLYRVRPASGSTEA